MKDSNNLIKTITPDKPTTTITDGLALDLKRMTDNITTLVNNTSENEIIDTTLKNTSDNNLRELMEIFDPKRRIRTEERLLQMSHILVTDLVLLDNAEQHLAYTRNILINTIINIFTNTFNYEKGGTMLFDNNGFLKKVEAEINYRKAVKDMTTARTSTSTSSTATTVAVDNDNNSCTIS